MKKKVTIIILIVLVVICLLVAIWLLVFKKETSCNFTPTGYDYLSGFEEGSNCDEKKYKVLATIYNGKIENNTYTFDLNTIDSKGRENKYYENISLDVNKITEDQISILDQNIGIVDIEFFFEKSNKNVFSKELTLSGVLLKKHSLDEIKSSEYIKGMYSSLKEGPLKGKQTSTPRTTFIEKNTVTYSTVPDNQELYYFWLLSYIEKNWENENIQSLFQNKPDTKTIINAEKEYILKNTDLEDKNAYLSNLAFSCSLYKDIEKNIGKVDKELKKYYCDSTVLAEVIPDTYEFFTTKHGSFVTRDVFNSTVGYEEPKESLKEYSRRNNTNLSLLAAYFDSDVKKNENFEKQAQTITENYYDVFKDVNNSIQNDCLLAYTYSLASKKNDDPYYKNTLGIISDSFLRNLTSVQKSLDNDIYSSVLCYEAYKDGESSIKSIFYSNVLKSLYLDYYNTDERVGVWEKNNVYDSKTNVLLINLLLNRNE